jgi:hypothetical protein
VSSGPLQRWRPITVNLTGAAIVPHCLSHRRRNFTVANARIWRRLPNWPTNCGQCKHEISGGSSLNLLGQLGEIRILLDGDHILALLRGR